MEALLDRTPTELPKGADILERIKDVFAEKGFDGASMQDLARAAGMSAGNFYRYFPSKDAIIAAMTRRDMDQTRAEFDGILASPDPMKAFRAALDSHLAEGAKDGALWVQMEAAAARRPEIAAQLAETADAIIGHMLAVFAHLSGRTIEEMKEKYTAHVHFILMLVRELSISQSNCGFRPAEVSPNLRLLVVRTIETIAAEITGIDADTIGAAASVSGRA